MRNYPYRRRYDDTTWLGLIAMAVAILAIALVLFIIPWTDPVGASSTLYHQGYKNVHITGYRWFAGSESDHYHTGFEATSPSGDQVTGTVTSGLWMKGNTVRLDD
jgi:hypothetical protein